MPPVSTTLICTDNGTEKYEHSVMEHEEEKKKKNETELELYEERQFEHLSCHEGTTHERK